MTWSGPWHVGDRVRVFNSRNGRVVPLEGRLRAVFPNGTIEWLNFAEPDEDGPEHLAERCMDCNRLHRRRDVLCINCDSEFDKTLPTWAKRIINPINSNEGA